MVRKQRKIPPSRKKYEDDNPVVSFRATKKDKNEFAAIRQKRTLSHGAVYRIGLGIIQVKSRAEEEVRQQAYDEGLEYGIEVTEELYAISCPCNKCGKKKTVIDEDEKNTIREFMIANLWCHANCDDVYS